MSPAAVRLASEAPWALRREPASAPRDCGDGSLEDELLAAYEVVARCRLAGRSADAAESPEAKRARAS